MQQANPTQEAKALNVRIEREGDEFIAVLPPHPDLKDDEEVGFPAPTEQEALDEARAYRAIEQSKVYKFEYDDKRDLYSVTFGNSTHSAKFLAHAYRDAQKAYAEHINQQSPEAEPAPPPPAPKQRRKRAAGNGSKAPLTGDPPPSNPEATMERERITSGIGDKPTQLAPAQNPEQSSSPARNVEAQNPWITLDERITRLEVVLRDAIVATARALEGLNRR